MKFWRYILCLTAYSLSQAVVGYADCLEECYESPCCDQLTYSPLRIDATGLVGKGIGGDNQNCALSLFFAPSTKGNWQPFIDLKGHHLGSSSWAANAGLGMRWLTSCDRTFGVNVFYDYRDYNNAAFSQIGAGLESLGKTFDFRVNGYFPFNKQVSDGVLFDDYIGGYFVEALYLSTPMTGVDGEIGMSLINRGLVSLYAACGPYYYCTTNNRSLLPAKNTFGGMARVAFQWTNYVELEVKVSYDHLFRTKVQGLLQLTLPFDACFDICKWTKDVCQNIFLKPVERREVIVLYNSGLIWEGNY